MFYRRIYTLVFIMKNKFESWPLKIFNNIDSVNANLFNNDIR